MFRNVVAALNEAQDITLYLKPLKQHFKVSNFNYHLPAEKFYINDIYNESLYIFLFLKYVEGYRTQRVSRYCSDDLSNDALYMFGLLQLQLLQHTR